MGSNNKKWFEGSIVLDCDLERIRSLIADPGDFFIGVTSDMSGITSVEMVEQGGDSVTIATNEGQMKRSNISINKHSDRIEIEYDEEYQAGSVVTARSHFYGKFLEMEKGVNLRIVISNVNAPGVIGFVYRKFGSSNIGNAILQSHKTYIESSATK